MLSSDGLIVCDRVILGGASISRKNHDGVALDNFSNRLLNDQRVTTVIYFKITILKKYVEEDSFTLSI